jgi:hypothetical protein
MVTDKDKGIVIDICKKKVWFVISVYSFHINLWEEIVMLFLCLLVDGFVIFVSLLTNFSFHG